MHPFRSYNHTPAPDQGTEHDLPADFTEQAINAAADEAEDLLADIAAEKYKEAKRISKEVREQHSTPWPTNSSGNR
jgi:hypothetical protein